MAHLDRVSQLFPLLTEKLISWFLLLQITPGLRTMQPFMEFHINVKTKLVDSWNWVAALSLPHLWPGIRISVLALEHLLLLMRSRLHSLANHHFLHSLVDPSTPCSASIGFSFHSSGGSNTVEFSTPVSSMPNFSFFSPGSAVKQGKCSLSFSAEISRVDATQGETRF